MKGYWIVHSVFDPSALTKYVSLTIPTSERASGKFLVGALPTRLQLDGIQKQRTEMIEFPSIERAIAAYRSEGYGHAQAALLNATERDFRYRRSSRVAGVSNVTLTRQSLREELDYRKRTYRRFVLHDD